ncbi:MAG: hypothetical protein JKX79_05675 [Labilibaculum sp.]|nr:hypothetical protein [Labilibaculum sp.]
MNFKKLLFLILGIIFSLSVKVLGQCITISNIELEKGPKGREVPTRRIKSEENFNIKYNLELSSGSSRGYAYWYLSKDKTVDSGDVLIGTVRFWRSKKEYIYKNCNVDYVDPLVKYLIVKTSSMCNGVYAYEYKYLSINNEELIEEKADLAIKEFKCIGTGSMWSAGENIPTIRQGQVLNIYYDLSNEGDKTASNGEVLFYLSANSEDKISKSDTELWPSNIFSSIKGGRSYQYLPVVDIPASYTTVTRVFYLKAKVVLNDYSETDDANNLAKCKIYIFGSGSASIRPILYPIEFENPFLHTKSGLVSIKENGLELSVDKVKVISNDTGQMEVIVPEWYLNGEIIIYHQNSTQVYRSNILNTSTVINSSELQDLKGLFIIRVVNNEQQETIKIILP